MPYTSRCVYTWMDDVGDGPARGHKPVSPTGDPGTGTVPITRAAGCSVPPRQPRAATKGILLALEKAQRLAGDNGSLCHRGCLCGDPPPWHPHGWLQGDRVPLAADPRGHRQGWVRHPATLSCPQGGGWCRYSPCSPVTGITAGSRYIPGALPPLMTVPKADVWVAASPTAASQGSGAPWYPPSIQDHDFGTRIPGSPSPAYPAPRGARRRGGGGCRCPRHPATWWLPVTGRLRAAWRAGGARGPASCRRVLAGQGPRFKSKQC